MQEKNTPKLDALIKQLQEMGLDTKGTITDLEKRIKRAIKKKEQQQIQEQKRIEEANPFPFDYYLVCDVEGTCLENSGFDYANEIIEFPVILINSSLEIVDTFHSYCRPTINPILSDFCIKYTGITQEIVDSADTFKTVFDSFLNWLSKYCEPPYKQCIFVTDGIWDLRDFVEKEMSYLGLTRPRFMNQIVDIRKKYQKFYVKEATNLEGMLKELNMEFEGRQHSGIDDAKNIAKIFIKMAKDGCKMDASTNLLKHKIKGKWRELRK